MDKWMAMILIILGVAGLAVAALMVLSLWAINKTNNKEWKKIQEHQMYESRNVVYDDDHDVPGLIDED